MKAPLERTSTTRSRSFSRAEWLFLGSLFAFCLAVALTQEVNPFPIDHWFASQYKLFSRVPGADNYTPIAAPAYVYFTIHVLAKMLGLGLEAEFYLGSLAHHLFVFLAGVCLYLSHRLLGMAKIGLLVSTMVVVYTQSTLLAQAFWSENVALLLMSITILCIVRIVVQADDGHRSLRRWSLALGLATGLSVITRVVPIVLLPGLLWLFHHQLDRHRARLASATVTLCVIAVVVVAMSANLWRFDRFELSNSTGRHLWQNISPLADEMLEGSAEYQLLKRADPAIAGKNWWKVPYGPVAGLEHLSREELLRLLSWQAITSHPLRYLRIGVENTLLVLQRAPWRLGQMESPGYNPLARDSMLPPLLAPFPKLDDWLWLIHKGSEAVWPLATYGTLLVWAISALLSRRYFPSRRSAGRSARPAGAFAGIGPDVAPALGAFLAFALVIPLWATCQIELPVSRYQLPYLPVLGLLLSTGLLQWARFWQAARASPRPM